MFDPFRQLAKGSLELESAINLSNLQQVDANSPDFVKLYGRLLHAWLLAIAWITVPDLTQNLRVIQRNYLSENFLLWV